MPAKKIDPEEQKQKEKRVHVKRKLFFVASIAILVLVTNLFMIYRSKNEVEQAAIDEDVLGETAVLTEDEKARLERVQKQATELVEDVTSKTESYVEESRDKTEESLNEILYRTTIRPLLEKIESLPEQQQEYVKEQLCRPESARSGP